MIPVKSNKLLPQGKGWLVGVSCGKSYVEVPAIAFVQNREIKGKKERKKTILNEIKQNPLSLPPPSSRS